VDRYASQCEMRLFLFNWCASSTLQVILLIRRQIFIRNAANALNPGKTLFLRLVISEVRLTTLTGLAEPEAFAIGNSDWPDRHKIEIRTRRSFPKGTVAARMAESKIQLFVVVYQRGSLRRGQQRFEIIARPSCPICGRAIGRSQNKPLSRSQSRENHRSGCTILETSRSRT
jgi:hypothetical protein